jgi:NAD-specific glutamate dehydrogenase
LSLLRSVTEKNFCLNSSLIHYILIRIDAFVRILAVKEVGNKFDDTRDTSGTTDQNDFMDVRLVDLGIAENLINIAKSTTEEILAELVETGTSEGSVEVDLDGCSCSRRVGTLGRFASSAETTNRTPRGRC